VSLSRKSLGSPGLEALINNRGIIRWVAPVHGVGKSTKVRALAAKLGWSLNFAAGTDKSVNRWK